jgi:hypothetical protein
MSRLSNVNQFGFGPAALFGVGAARGGTLDEEERLRQAAAQQAAAGNAPPSIMPPWQRSGPAAPEQAPMPQPAGNPIMQALDAMAPGARKETAGGYPADGATQKPGGFNPDFFSTVTGASGTQRFPWHNTPDGPRQQGAPEFTPSGQGMDPIAPYLSAITGTGFGQSPMQMDPQVRMAAMGMMNSDQDRALRGRLGEMQFGNGGYNQQRLGLEQRQQDLHATLAREQMANQMALEERKRSPQGLKETALLGLATRAGTDPSFDYERVPSIMSELDKMMGNFGTGGPRPAPVGGDGRGLGVGAAQPAAPQAAAAPPGTPSPQQQVDRIIGQLRPAFGSVAMGPGGKGGETFIPSKPEEITQPKMLDAIGRLQGFNLDDPAIQGELTRRVQRGDIGDATTLRKLLAQQIGGDYLLANPPPRDQGGALPSSYSIPGLFEMREQKPGTFFGDLARRAGRGLNADSLPYNKIVLPSGEAIDFSPREAGAGVQLPSFAVNPLANAVKVVTGEDPVASAINNRKSKGEDAKRRLPASQALLRALMGQAGAPAGK